MKPPECKSCGHEFREWVEFCPNCAEPMEGYSRPAGFWIRFGAQIIDTRHVGESFCVYKES